MNIKPGQVLTKWFQDLCAGRLTTPQAIIAAQRAENPDAAQAADRFLDIPQDDLVWDAPKRLAAPGFFCSEAQIWQWQRADWQHVDYRLRYWAALYQEYARKHGIPLYVHAAYRGEADQNAAVARGVSKASFPRSAHNIGEAVDIVHGKFHWDMTRQEWSMLHVLGLRALDVLNARLRKDRRFDLTWGGDFKSLYDPAHWEISDYRSRVRRLPAGTPVRFTPRHVLRKLQI